MKRKSVIFVHGIGRQIEGYSDDLWNLLWKGNPPADVHKYELLYYDIFEKIGKKIDIESILEKYGARGLIERIAKDKQVADDLLEQSTDILKNTVSHVFYFLLTRGARVAILNKFMKTLRKAIKDGTKQGISPFDHAITIISHSLGTVVAYKGLHYILGKRGLRPEQGVRIKNFFTLATPLALIAKVAGWAEPVVNLPNITGGIDKPKKWNPAENEDMSNIDSWYSYRNESDLVASLVPLVSSSLDNEDTGPYVFDEVHAGGAHDFENYIRQARDVISEKI